MKKHPQILTSNIRCAKFQPNPTIFVVSRLSQSFRLILEKTCAPKIKFFEKWKNSPDIYPMNKYTKFQPNPTDFWSLQAPAPKFWDIHTDKHFQILTQVMKPFQFPENAGNVQHAFRVTPQLCICTWLLRDTDRTNQGKYFCYSKYPLVSNRRGVWNKRGGLEKISKSNKREGWN